MRRLSVTAGRRLSTLGGLRSGFKKVHDLSFTEKRKSERAEVAAMLRGEPRESRRHRSTPRPHLCHPVPLICHPNAVDYYPYATHMPPTWNYCPDHPYHTKAHVPISVADSASPTKWQPITARKGQELGRTRRREVGVAGRLKQRGGEGGGDRSVLLSSGEWILLFCNTCVESDEEHTLHVSASAQFLLTYLLAGGGGNAFSTGGR